ncbi:MAG: hypothetical protein OCD00_18105 [Colwellia sp.]
MKQLITLVVLSAGICASQVQATEVTWVSSTEGEKWQAMPHPKLMTMDAERAPDILIRPEFSYQTIDGFGGSFNELGWVALSKASPKDSSKAIKALFGEQGANFNLARIPIGASDFGLDGYSLAMVPEDYQLKHFSIERDKKHLLPYIKAAMTVKPELQNWASPWSAPAWMKTNNSYSKGSLRNEAKIMRTYANYFTKWIDAYRQEGVNLYAITPQNEPNILNVYPTQEWSASLLSTFIGDYLGPRLKDKDIEIWLGLNGDPSNQGENANYRLTKVVENPKVRRYLTGVGFQYDSKNQIAVADELYPDLKLMQTESVCFNGDNSWQQAESLYKIMKRYFDGGANAYFAWNMILNETGKSTWDWAQNALITVDQQSGKVTYNGEFYIYKHFSHFIKPGATRVMSTSHWDNRIAFENPDGSVVVVVANSSDSSHQTVIGVYDDQATSFQVKVPAHSINTFVIKP